MVTAENVEQKLWLSDLRENELRVRQEHINGLLAWQNTVPIGNSSSVKNEQRLWSI